MKNDTKTVNDRNEEIERLHQRIKELEKIELEHKRCAEVLREQKLVSQELRREKQEKEFILDSLIEHVVYHDLDLRVLWANRAAFESVNRPRSELIGGYCYEIWGGRSTPCEGCPVIEAQETGKAQREEKTTEDGRSWIIRGYPVRNEKGNITGSVEITFETTEKKRIEEERNELEAQLIQSQKMQALGTLAGGIAHDFNNILYPVMGFTEMAMDDLPEESAARKNMKEVFEATKRARELVKQILAFSRQADQEREPVAVQPIIKETVKLLRGALPTTIEISQQIEEGCPAVMADPTQIHQVIMNLGTNAYHAMRDKGGELEVCLGSIDVAREDIIANMNLEPGPYLKLTIRDTGCGMDKDVMRRIFEPYYTTKSPGEGTGLGLSVVHGIVTSYGGDITVYSETGKGTAFNVYLPSIEPGTEDQKAFSTSAVPTGKERILLVDDEEQIVRMVRLMLERLGYRVTGRTSGIEALEVFRAQPEVFDLVITDQTMPKMTGVELSQELFRLKPDLPVILSTGFSEMVTERQAKAEGIKDHIMKPVVKKELACTVRKVLDQNRGE